MGKGEGAVDKNMRKELSLEIDGHAFAPAHESHRRHATDATPRRCPDQYVNDFTPLEFEEIVDLFKEFDKDKSGYIDEEELCEMMRALEMDHSLAKAKEMMLEIVLTQRSFGNFNMRRSSSSRDPRDGVDRDGVVPGRTRTARASWNSGNSALC